MTSTEHPFFHLITQTLIENRSRREKRRLGAQEIFDAASDAEAVIHAVEGELGQAAARERGD